MPTDKIQTGLRIDPELYQKAIVLAKREGRSLNNLCEYALRLYIQAYENQSGVIKVSED